jgi:hypothetical protein
VVVDRIGFTKEQEGYERIQEPSAARGKGGDGVEWLLGDDDQRDQEAKRPRERLGEQRDCL